MKGKKILLIDDECKTAGWEETLNAIFGDDVLKAIGENEKERRWQSTNDILNDPNVIAEITPDNHLNKYDLILLDLYLAADDEKKRSEDSSQQSSTYSGLQLLKEIRSKDPTVPVILFTASNKAFNVKAAEGIGIDGYFQKEGRYHSEEEAERYYRKFESLIEKCTRQERRILRDIRRYIEKFKISINNIENKNEIIQLLESAQASLTGYFKAKERNLSNLIGTLILLDQIIQLIWDKEQKDENGYKKYSYVYNPSSMNITLQRKNLKDDSPIYGFIVRQIRHSAAHPEDLRYTDAIFALFAIFKALGIENIDTYWKDPCPEWQFNKTVDTMIKSICSNACSGNCKSGTFLCDPSKADIYIRGMFLTLEDNLKTPESRKSQIVFRYLFFVLCLKRLNKEIPLFFLNLIKERLCKGNEKEFCPPFKDNRWGGIKMNDDTIDSPLGILKSDMSTEIRAEKDKVFFRLTEKYLRN